MTRRSPFCTSSQAGVAHQVNRTNLSICLDAFHIGTYLEHANSTQITAPPPSDLPSHARQSLTESLKELASAQDASKFALYQLTDAAPVPDPLPVNQPAQDPNAPGLQTMSHTNRPYPFTGGGLLPLSKLPATYVGQSCTSHRGAAGFGLDITEKLLSQSYHVLVVDISESVPSKSVDGDKVILRGDTKKRPDVVVNNAGINMTGKETHDVDEAFFDRLFNINVKSVYHSISACAPAMLKQKSGVFIHISSVGAVRPKPKIAYYCATKAAKLPYPNPSPSNTHLRPLCGNRTLHGQHRDLNFGPGVAATAENIAPMLANIPVCFLVPFCT
ncbi:hypothetical protein C8R43DRAFT_1135022 [Mycena crocata]|nr:hypothetical protein C8R43DRAFT_1135022 [Mycena crocata]